MYHMLFTYRIISYISCHTVQLVALWLSLCSDVCDGWTETVVVHCTGSGKEEARTGAERKRTARRGETQGTTAWHCRWSCTSVCLWWCTVAAGVKRRDTRYNNVTLPLVMHVSVFVMMYSCCRREEVRHKVQQRDIVTGHARQCVCDGVQLLQAWSGETQGTTTWHCHWPCTSVCLWWCTGMKLRDVYCWCILFCSVVVCLMCDVDCAGCGGSQTTDGETEGQLASLRQFAQCCLLWHVIRQFVVNWWWSLLMNVDCSHTETARRRVEKCAASTSSWGTVVLQFILGRQSSLALSGSLSRRRTTLISNPGRWSSLVLVDSLSTPAFT